MLRSTLLPLAAVLVAASSLPAGPLTEAQVTKIINDVRVVDPAKGSHAAAINEKIKDEIGLKTGAKSRSELLFQDNTLTRIGPETSFSFKAGTRDLTLDQGTMLLQVPKGLGGAKIRTAAVTAALTGTTILIQSTPKRVKVLVLEGKLRLFVNGAVGGSVLLRAGRMIDMRPDSKRIPVPVSVDLRHVMKTSSLVKMAKKGEPDLPSNDLIAMEIAKQAPELGSGGLVQADFLNNPYRTDAKLLGLHGVVDHPSEAPVEFSHHR